MAEAVAPVSFTASLTVAKTGRSKCVDPAFLGFVPPTTLVPCMYEHLSFDQEFWGIAVITVCDGLLGMETSQYQPPSVPAHMLGFQSSTHVPCLPVKPWKMTRVSSFMRRLPIVDEYAELAPM
jgi:hypothetical protein